ncbi:hypothetical protein HDU83_002255 [Entophlyctis luteolus]|nr:hypothetical protein HDU83_002255 [Entophlyctis luteolus]
MTCFGPENSFGIFAAYYLEQGLASASAVSLIGSIGAGAINLFGILTTILMNRYGFRRIMAIGAIFYFLGFFLASFCEQSLVGLIFTQAIIYGAGASLAYYPALSAPNQWFDKRRGIAMGLGVAGVGAGGVLYSIGTEQLLDHVGFAWTMRTVAFFSFVSICAVIPFVQERERRPETAGTAIDVAILTTPLFLVTLLCILFFCISFYIPSFYIPDYAMNALGADSATSSYLLTAYNVSAIAGRVIIGFVADLCLGRTNSLVLVVLLHSLSTIIWHFSSTLTILYVFAVVNGFMSGAFWVVFPVVVGEVFGDNNVNNLVGILFTANTLGSLLGPSIAGLFRDHLGYQALILFCGCLTLLSAVFAACLRFMFKPVLFLRT